MSAWKVKVVLNVVGARALGDFGWAGSIDAVVDGGAIHLSGWVLAADSRVARVALWGDDWMGEVVPSLASPDIAQAYPGHPSAEQSRFALSVPLGNGPSSLKVLTLHALPEGADGMHIATVICRRELQAAPRILVVGSPRSGTTAVGNALRHALGLPNYGESHVLPVLQSLIEDTDRRLGDPNTVRASQQLANMMAHLPSEELRERLGEVFRSMYRQLNHGESFCDKTPGVDMLRAVPMAQWLWPDAKFIFCKRRGLDNIASRMRKFKSDDFAGHCADWAMAMQVWLEASELIPAEQRCEVDQHDLLARPDAIGRELARWCGLDAAQVEAAAHYIANESPERTREADGLQVPAIDDLGWSPEYIAIFRELCGPMMHRYGYSEGSDYWRLDAEPAHD